MCLWRPFLFFQNFSPKVYSQRERVKETTIHWRKRWNMSEKNYTVITNNPLVLKKLDQTHDIVYEEVSYVDLLKKVRDRIHEGHWLLTHPLSGSVKPNETPYKSILISRRKENILDMRSLELIENALQSCGKFAFKSDSYSAQTLQDFQLIDWTLLESGLSSAKVW